MTLRKVMCIIRNSDFFTRLPLFIWTDWKETVEILIQNQLFPHYRVEQITATYTDLCLLLYANGWINMQLEIMWTILNKSESTRERKGFLRWKYSVWTRNPDHVFWFIFHFIRDFNKGSRYIHGNALVAISTQLLKLSHLVIYLYMVSPHIHWVEIWTGAWKLINEFFS